MTAASQKVIVWFRNNLRIHDNVILKAASDYVKTTTTTDGSIDKNCEIIGLYCFDPRHYGKTMHKSIKSRSFRTKFVIESVDNLRRNMKNIGGELLVSVDKPEDLLFNICKNTNNTIVLLEKEHMTEECYVESECSRLLSKTSAKLHVIESNSALYIDNLPYRSDFKDFPDTFTIFREKVEKTCKMRSMTPSIRISDKNRLKSDKLFVDEASKIIHEKCNFDYLPTLSDIYTTTDTASAAVAATSTATSDDRMALIDQEISASVAAQTVSEPAIQFVGGEDAAIDRIDKWMFKEDNLKDYFDIRNGMLGQRYSSKLSPYLALGCISSRYIVDQVYKYERTRDIKNKSTYWLIFELLWRDFFINMGRKYQAKLFHPYGAKNVISKHDAKKWLQDGTELDCWKDGMTGIPLVDANQRELLYSGWMSNRGRQNVASFLIHNLNIDWRYGADHFESLLVDHDVNSNWGNWHSAAGLLGGRANIFNIVKQSKDYDCDGEYIKHWLPELNNIPAPLCFEPWKMSMQDQTRYKCILGKDYPLPIVSVAPGSSSSSSSSSGGGGSSSSYKNSKSNSSKSGRRDNNDKRRGTRVQHY